MFNETNRKYLVVYNIITYFLSKIKINITDFCNVQILCNDHIKTLGKGKEEETWLNRNAGQTATAREAHFITVLREGAINTLRGGLCQSRIIRS